MIRDDWRLRWYVRGDADRLVALLAECVPDENWTAGDVARFIGHGQHVNVVKVLTDGDELYGAFMYTLTAGVGRVRRVAVRPDVRRQGLATHMLNALCGPTSVIRRKSYAARVREDNLPAIKLFKDRMGFAFDPARPRERDEVRGVDYYEFTLTR